jgi:hypothetical protein
MDLKVIALDYQIDYSAIRYSFYSPYALFATSVSIHVFESIVDKV